nr:hypothetical protein [uncultured Treponema sp.]
MLLKNIQRIKIAKDGSGSKHNRVRTANSQTKNEYGCSFFVVSAVDLCSRLRFIFSSFQNGQGCPWLYTEATFLFSKNSLSMRPWMDGMVIRSVKTRLFPIYMDMHLLMRSLFKDINSS